MVSSSFRLTQLSGAILALLPNSSKVVDLSFSSLSILVIRIGPIQRESSITEVWDELYKFRTRLIVSGLVWPWQSHNNRPMFET